jgi:HTH-type transcriptional regulator/antitoxin HipB
MGSEFGTRIRRLREQADLSQESLAGLAGISREWLAKIESGKNPGLSVVIRVATALTTSLPEVTIADMFEGYEGIPPARPTPLRLASYAHTRLAEIVGPADPAHTVSGRLASASTRARNHDVNGHQDLPLGGQLTSQSADTRNPGRRTARRVVASGQWHHPLALGGLGQAQ